MIRSIIAVVSGFVVIVIFALAADALLMRLVPSSFTDGGATRNSTLLIFALVYNFIFSAAGGYLTALIARRVELKHALALGALHFLLSLLSAVQFTETAPVWWHIAALALIIPAVVFGGYLRVAQKRVSQPRTV